MKLVVGLGNPGKKYQLTRHNAGFIAIDHFVAQHSGVWKKEPSFFSETCTLQLGPEKIIFAKPQTYMNGSGQAVQAILNFYKIKTSNLLVIHDEKDFVLGSYKIQHDRSAAGHQGVQSIIDHLNTKTFTRVRIGIGPKNLSITSIETYVLEKFLPEDIQKLNQVVEIISTELPQTISNLLPLKI